MVPVSTTRTSTRDYHQKGVAFLLLSKTPVCSRLLREWIIERALALNDAEVSAEKIKWIALWKFKGDLLALWLEDLVREGGLALHTLH